MADPQTETAAADQGSAPDTKPVVVSPATPGRILNYVIAKGDLEGDRSVGEIRPAMVVRVWPNEYPDAKMWDRSSPGDNPTMVPCTTDGYNVQIFLDGSNLPEGRNTNDGQGSLWLTSLPICDAPIPGRLHWPLRS